MSKVYVFSPSKSFLRSPAIPFSPTFRRRTPSLVLHLLNDLRCRCTYIYPNSYTLEALKYPSYVNQRNTSHKQRSVDTEIAKERERLKGRNVQCRESSPQWRDTARRKGIQQYWLLLPSSVMHTQKKQNTRKVNIEETMISLSIPSGLLSHIEYTGICGSWLLRNLCAFSTIFTLQG